MEVYYLHQLEEVKKDVVMNVVEFLVFLLVKFIFQYLYINKELILISFFSI